MDMGKFDELFDAEDSVFGGTPESKYWDIHNQLSEDLKKDEFDALVEKMAIMEAMLTETHDIEQLSKIMRGYAVSNHDKITEMKRSLYLELAGQLIFRVSD